MKLKDLFKCLWIRWSSGKAFDPHYQERQDAEKDIVKGQEKRKKVRK